MNDISGPLFEATVEHRDDACIVHASGEIDVASAPTFVESLREATDETDRIVIVDLSLVSLLDSTGLGALIEYLELLRSRGHETRLRLVVSESQILKVFAITGLDQVFSIFPSIANALAN